MDALETRPSFDIFTVLAGRPRRAGTFFGGTEGEALEAKARSLCFASVEALEAGLGRTYRALPEDAHYSLTEEALLAFCQSPR